MTGKPTGILFLCVANSARSQIAEGWCRWLMPEGTIIYSAGSHPGSLNPDAVQVMKEMGVDISAHFSKAVEAIPLHEIGTVVTLCAEEVCPHFEGTVERLDIPFIDPAANQGVPEDRLEAFRRTRDEIEKWMKEFVGDRDSRKPHHR